MDVLGVEYGGQIQPTTAIAQYLASHAETRCLLSGCLASHAETRCPYATTVLSVCTQLITSIYYILSFATTANLVRVSDKVWYCLEVVACMGMPHTQAWVMHHASYDLLLCVNCRATSC